MRMRTSFSPWHALVGSVVFGILCSAALLIAADTKPADTKAAAPKTAVKEDSAGDDDATSPKKKRLPQFYAQVISPDQREKIYKIQELYAPRLTELETKLAALRDEMETELRTVLTLDQQKRLDSLMAAAKAKQDAPKRTPADGKPNS